MLNLPTKITFNGNEDITNRYMYSAGGQKLQVFKQDLSGEHITDYVGSNIYENGSLRRTLVDGGYIEDGNYYYFLTDHHGNTRVVSTAAGEVVQSNHYYPYGLSLGEGVDSSDQPYKYNGKELDLGRGLNLYDYGARLLASDWGRFTTIDPLSEKYPWLSPYAYCANNPIRFVDPDGRDYFQSTSGALIWQNDYNKTVTINDEVYNNVGATTSVEMADGSYVNYYQNVAVSTTDGAINVEQSVLNDTGLVGSLLGAGSPLTSEAQGKLMADVIHNAQGNFVAGAAEVAGTALETTGTGLSVAGYAVSATGVGAGVGGAMSGVGSILSGIGTGLQLATDLSNQNYGQAAIRVVGAASNFGVAKLASFGAAGSEQINAGVNLFFTPVSTMIGNINYNKP